MNHTVYEGALDRLRWLFDEFENLYVSFSGGKDSTIVLELAIMVAREKGRLPVDVMFLDQEAEWDVVINYVRRTMDRPEVRPHWLQVPFRLFNAASTSQPWLTCWEDGLEGEWVRPKQSDSLHENVYGVDRFYDMFPAFTAHQYPSGQAVSISGVRCQESPNRQAGLTNAKTYKHATWGRVDHKAKQHFSMHPIYDWAQTDVWKAIHDNGWDYCRLYDLMYQYGVGMRKMRVSSVCHEGALNQVLWMQEMEPVTWGRIFNRIDGMHSVGQMQDAFKRTPETLPFMFDSWQEYRDHLLENLITDPAIREKMRGQIVRSEGQYKPEIQVKLCKAHIRAILTNDHFGTKLTDFSAAYNKNWSSTRKRRVQASDH